MRLALGLILTMQMVATAALAETAYVTDNLRLGLYESENTTGRAFHTMDSGQEMEILVRGTNTANVRLPDGRSGWVKSAYLVTEKPAKLIVAETQAQRDAFAAELEAAKAAFAEPAAAIAKLEGDAANLAEQLATANASVADLEAERLSVQSLKEQYKGSLPLSWVGAAIAVCLIAGFLGGLWWTDRQSRARHGGIRIY